ncbi:GDP-fucose protein O-fucosyltransferase 2, putative [Plasmodium reichenowi]|uniref:GDP-fucose protein O-fucosyltransferase 2 n=1 Tax=Plasmodium reichenowi TaxID=5854 RepID=A0A151LHE3_PLARE|nr:GDP-fucose protein O-fucosyltransferase 2, putative [Plasmodium reichenowi]KYN98384.1 GDP-fucose protein O-fucosyltransferase 2, putative [Plasmodium reichenowi]
MKFIIVLLLFFFFKVIDRVICVTPPKSICLKEDVYLGDSFFFLKEKKYIMYDVNIGEGFNLQKEIFYRLSLVIYNLNKKDKLKIYYLVLPPWCYVTHWNRKKGNNLRWEFFFNTDIMKKVIPIIEYEEYEKLYGNYCDIMINSKYILDNYKEKSFLILPFEECNTNVNSFKQFCKKCEYKYNIIYSGYCTTINTKESECYSYNMISNYFITSILKNLFLYDITSVLIKQSTNILVPFVNELYENNLEDILLFNNKLLLYANNYISNILKTNHYISSHLRYNDFKNISRYNVPPIHIALVKLLYIMFINNCRIIFIASDEKLQIQKVIDQYFYQYKKHFYFYNNQNNLHEGEFSIIEQWICTRSHIFIGNIFSRFTMNINWERHLINKGQINNNIDLCSYHINNDNDQDIKNSYKKIVHIFNHKALQKIKNIYYNYSDKDRKYINTICYNFPSHFPNNISIYRKEYISNI